jgi:hypothetical protein
MAHSKLLTPAGQPIPGFQLQFYAVNKKGEYGAAALRPSKFAVCDSKGARHEDCAVLFPG